MKEMNKQESGRHVIVGGGFSGLFTAYRLSRRGITVDIYEKNHWGGMIQTLRLEEGLVETAANGFLCANTLYQLCQELHVPLLATKPTAKNRYLHDKRGFFRWPLSIIETLVLLIKVSVAFLTKNLRPQEDETVLAWGERVLGLGGAHRLLRTALQGVYAAPADELSAQAILGRFFTKSKKPRPAKPPLRGLVSVAGGMGKLIDAMVKDLQGRPCVRFHDGAITASQVKEWNEDPSIEQIWLATSAKDAAHLCREALPLLTAQLDSIQGRPVMTATLFFAPTKSDLQGFGYLNHPELESDALGVLFNNEIFPGRSEYRSENWILKGEGRQKFLQRDDADIVNHLLEERQRWFPGPQKLLNAKITRWPWGLPHYNLTLARSQASFQKDWGKVILLGNYVKGIGLTQIADYILEKTAEKSEEAKAQ